MLEDILIKHGGVEVTAMELYTDMFSLGENIIQRRGELPGRFKANPIGYYRNEGDKTGHYRIFFDDTFEETLRELQEADFAIINGVTYYGRRNAQDQASTIHALIFDLDGVTDWTLDALCNIADVTGWRIPKPNYIALSGHGIHIYYLFDYPIPLYPNIKIQLKAFKYALLERLWTEDTSEDRHRQYQGINQGFRPIGGKTKIDGVRVRAFRMYDHPYILEQLGEYIPEEYRVDESKLFKESKLTLEEAQKLYPAWYQDKVVGKQPRRYWTFKRDLYDWWKRQIIKGASHHHRYFCVMCLAIYGAKCGLELPEVKADALELVPFLNNIKPEEPFTESDVLSALDCFDLKYCTFPRDDMAKISGISIPVNKRNYQKQADHLEEARAIRDIRQRRQGKKWTDGNGRPKGSGSKGDIVRQWQEEHPGGIKINCHKDTGLSRPTIDKYWEFAKNHFKPQEGDTIACAGLGNRRGLEDFDPLTP